MGKYKIKANIVYSNFAKNHGAYPMDKSEGVNKLVYQLVSVLIPFLFFIKAFATLDPDFGWHLRTGQTILEKGISYSDPFSYTMPSYPYIDHAWLTDTFIAVIYPFVGMVGLAFVATLIFLLTFFLIAGTEKVLLFSTPLKKPKIISKILFVKLGPFSISFPFLLAIGILMPYFSIRTQLMTWFFMALLLRIIFDSATWRKWRFILPIIFIFWVNLHGGFVSGLIVLYFTLFARAVRSKGLDYKDLLISTLCLLVTLVNPYGLSIWREVFLTLTSSSLRSTIVEWMPAFLHFNLPLAFLSAFSVIFILRYRKKFPVENLGLYVLFLSQGLLSTKLIPIWTIVAVPMTTIGISFLYEEIGAIKYATSRFRRSYKAIWLAAFGLIVVLSLFTLRNALSLSERKFYPEEAVQYLRQNTPEGEMFSKYGWGGYLIWKYPEKKVFIDGRMAIWKWSQAPVSESPAIFEEYNDLLSGEIKYQEIFEKYGVDTVLWPASKSPGFYDLLQERLDNLLILFGKEKSDFDFLQQFSEDGWQEVYKDSVAVIYKKPS